MTLPDLAWLDRQFDADTLDDALEKLNALIDAHPDNADLLRVRAALWERVYRTRDAAADWERIVALDPTDHATALRLALMEISRPHRLLDDEEDDEAFAVDGEPEDGEESDPAGAAEDDDEDGEGVLDLEALLAEADAEDDWEGASPEAPVRDRGFERLLALVDAGVLDEGETVEAATTLLRETWEPWHALEVIQHGLARWPSSAALLRLRAALWLGMTTDVDGVGEQIPVGYSVDVLGNAFHPGSAGTALAYCAALPDDAWDADLHERHAAVRAHLADYEAAARAYRAAAAQLEQDLQGLADEEERNALREKMAALHGEAEACDRGPAGLIAAQQRGMEELMGRLTALGSRLSGLESHTDLPPGTFPATEPMDLRELGDSLENYMDAIAADPAEDEAYVDEIMGKVPTIARGILKSLDDTPYRLQALDRLRLYDLTGADAGHYEQARAEFAALGFRPVGWFEAEGLSAKIGRHAVLDVLLSADGRTVGTFYALSGTRGPEFVSLFANGETLTHVGVRGRLASLWPRPYQQVQTPPSMSLAQQWRLHQRELAVRRAEGIDTTVLSPEEVPELLERLRAARLADRLRRGFSDLELQGWLTSHYRVAGDGLRQEVDRLMGDLRGRGVAH